jgi:hypothetical protein
MTQTSQTPETTTQLQDFDEFVRTTMQDWKLPGLAIAIVKNGEVILSQGFGKRNIAQDLEVTPNTLFPIGSCTKKEIIFKRVASKEMTEKSFLEQFVGEYEFMGRSMTVALRGKKTLIATIPGQPDYELEPYKGTEFQLKGLTGFSLAFKKDATGVVTEVVITQPYGIVTAKKKM